MPDNSSPEIPQPPELSKLPDPGKSIRDMLARINQANPQQSEANQAQNPEDNVREETERFLGALPQELQRSLRGFYLNVARSIVEQQTTMNGDQVEVRVTPGRLKYYNSRLTEVIDSGFLNPHISPPKKITE